MRGLYPLRQGVHAARVVGQGSLARPLALAPSRIIRDHGRGRSATAASAPRDDEEESYTQPCGSAPTGRLHDIALFQEVEAPACFGVDKGLIGCQPWRGLMPRVSGAGRRPGSVTCSNALLRRSTSAFGNPDAVPRRGSRSSVTGFSSRNIDPSGLRLLPVTARPHAPDFTCGITTPTVSVIVWEVPDIASVRPSPVPR